jgi:alpha-N-arabinofuranosidase
MLTVLSLGVPAPAQQPGASGRAEPLVVSIDASKLSEPISRYDYGMFMEHLGNLINHGLWSEMLDDRKFYYPVTSAEPKGAAPVLPFLPRPRRWVPFEPDDFIAMDRDHPYVGDHTPRIALEGQTPHGIQQAGLALLRSKEYIGRIVLAGTPEAKIEISLIWGPGAGEHQTIAITNLQTTYMKYPLEFTSGADTRAGRLEIVGRGSGSFHLGAVSLMPADNIHGFRPDTTRLLRELNSGMYRLPGGNFISDHDWRDAIGDPDKRPPTWDYAWNAVQPNDVGFDELMTLCQLLKVEPYITVNAGLGDDHSAAELVEYSNGSVDTPMGALRARNGHAEPYGVKYWNVGNEMYGFWQIGHTALRYYVLKHNAFAKAMRKVDPSITIIASGAMPDEMTVTSNARMVTGKVQAEYGTAADWTGGLLAHSRGYFDALSEHWYCQAGKRFDMTPHKDIHDPTYDTNDAYVPVEESLVDWIRRPSNRVRLKAEAWEEYKKRFPAITDQKIFVAIDEWAYITRHTNLKLALSYGMVLQEMFRHTDFIKMAAFTMGISALDYSGTDATYNTNGLTLKLYREHFGTIPVEVTGNSPQAAPKWPIGGDQPHVNAGSPTYPLDVAAAFAGDHKSLTVAVVNPTESVQRMELTVRGVQLGGNSTLWQLTGPTVDAANVLGQKPQVDIVSVPLPGVPKTLSVAPISISIYQFPVL